MLYIEYTRAQYVYATSRVDVRTKLVQLLFFHVMIINNIMYLRICAILKVWSIAISP